MPGTAHLATKDELEALKLATRSDLKVLELNLRAELSEKMRLQSWAMLVGTATIVAIATAIIKLA